jgi:hypothetical protein
MRVLLVTQSEQGGIRRHGRAAVVRPNVSTEFVSLEVEALPKADGHLGGADGAVE